MNIDFIRGATAHFVAAIILLAATFGILLMMFFGMLEPKDGLTPFMTIVGAAGAFIWQAESAKQAAKQARNDLLQQPPDPPPAP